MIKKMREKMCMSQQCLAEKLGVNRSIVSKWESGLCYPRRKTLLKLCEIFNCTMDELLREEGTNDVKI